MTAGGLLEIQRATSAYVLPRTAGDPEAQRARLDGLLTSDVLPRAAAALDDGGDALWCIRRIELDVEVDGWADALAGALAEAIAVGPDGEAVVGFADRADFLAAFVSDVLGGRAWGRWYYAELEPLAALPAATAAREALAREPAHAEAALARLAASGRLERLLAATGERATETLLALCAAGGGRGERGERGERHVVEAVVAAWRDVVAPVCDAATRLRLHAGARARLAPDVPAAAIAAAVELVVALAAELRAGLAPERAVAALAAAVAPRAVEAGAGDGPAAEAAAHAAARAPAQAPVDARVDAPAAALAGAGGSRWAAPLVAALSDPAADRRRSALRAGFATPFGAVFHLLPVLAEVDALLEDPVLRAVVLLQCLGAERAAEAAGDPALTLALGLDAPYEPDERAAAIAAADPAALTAGIVTWLADRGRLDGRRGAVAAGVAVDAATGYWVGVDGPDPLAVAREVTGLPFAPGAPVPRGVEADRDYLAGAPACALVARTLLRELAARWQGFGRSSAAYLWSNLLAGTSVVRVQAGRIDVELPAVPLDVVLRMSGVDGLTYTVPWLEPTAVSLALPPP
jgi:hypothetical protein